ncbi:GNAT family N-acetyltransferase [Streptomyces sp. NPDC051940]|uniref:GNAT family N-acetyltransferase n=1 Tax=Streptomyces sp. NPDC051940 TaxID=3155675 RepID=UPI00344A50C4
MSGDVTLPLPLAIRDLRHEDLASCGWMGSLHLVSVGRALDRAAAGEADYLALVPPSGMPLAKGGVDYAVRADAGTLWQLVVFPALRSLGLGTLLIGALEQRIRARGLHWAELGVESSNPRARALYERLGYTECGTRPESWDRATEDGTLYRYETVCTVLRKAL